MKQFALLLFVFVEMACSNTPSHNSKSVHGDPGPNTITVTVGSGFLYRGTYHLPSGTRLGLLLDVARVLPSAKDLRSDGVVKQLVPCSVRSAGGKYRATADFGKVTKPEFRSMMLHDGDEVGFLGWNF